MADIIDENSLIKDLENSAAENTQSSMADALNNILAQPQTTDSVPANAVIPQQVNQTAPYAAMTDNAYASGINAANIALGASSQAAQTAIETQISSTVKNRDLQAGLLSAYQDQRSITNDAGDKLQTLNRFTGLPGKLGEASGIITGILGMFDTDYNRQYQESRIAAAQQKTLDIAHTVQVQEDINNVAPQISELQSRIAANTMSTLTQGLDLNDKYVQHQMAALSYTMQLSAQSRQALTDRVNGAPDSEVNKMASVKSPEQGVWMKEQFERTRMRKELAAYAQQETAMGLQNILEYAPTHMLQQAVQNAEASGAPAITMKNPVNGKNIVIPIGLAKNAVISGSDRDKKFVDLATADYMDKANLAGRFGQVAQTATALAPVNPKLAGVMRAFAAIPANSLSKLSYPEAAMLNGMIGQSEAEIQKTVKQLATTMPTKESKAAILSLAATGKFSPENARAYIQAVAINPAATQTSMLAPVFDSLRQNTQQTAKVGKYGAGLLGKKPDDAMRMAMGIGLQDNNVRNDLKKQAAGVFGASAMVMAIKALASDPNAAPIWKQLVSDSGKNLWYSNPDYPDSGRLADTLVKAELEQTVKNGVKGRNMRGVYTNTLTQTLQRITRGADNYLGASPAVTLADRALISDLYGGANPYSAFSRAMTLKFNSDAIQASKQLDKRLQQDATGQTRSDAMYQGAAENAAMGGGPYQDAYVHKKLKTPEDAQILSSTGTRLTLQQIKQLQANGGY